MKQKIFTEREIILKIKEKRELSGISPALIEDLLNSYVKKHKINLSNLSYLEIKELVKIIRSQLRKYSGQFQKSFKKRDNSLAPKNIRQLLKSHSSTNERLTFYPSLKKIIKKISPSSILDLGCGLNPLALANPKIKYYAYDIKQDELDLIKNFFIKKKIDGAVKLCDLRKSQENFPQVDLCLMFKLLDVIDSPPYNITEMLLSNVRCKKFLVSFSTVKLSGKKMNLPHRYWFENILKKRNLSYKKFNSDNEIFYLIDNSI